MRCERRYVCKCRIGLVFLGPGVLYIPRRPPVEGPGPQDRYKYISKEYPDRVEKFLGGERLGPRIDVSGCGPP